MPSGRPLPRPQEQIHLPALQILFEDSESRLLARIEHLIERIVRLA
jgi:hypothetical protein